MKELENILAKFKILTQMHIFARSKKFFLDLPPSSAQGFISSYLRSCPECPANQAPEEGVLRGPEDRQEERFRQLKADQGSGEGRERGQGSGSKARFPWFRRKEEGQGG